MLEDFMVLLYAVITYQIFRITWFDYKFNTNRNTSIKNHLKTNLNYNTSKFFTFLIQLNFFKWITRY